MTSGPPLGGAVGAVTAFDTDSGWGVVTDGRDEFPFHSTAIADGSRTIELGVAVAFETVPGRMGRWEAAGVRRLES